MTVIESLIILAAALGAGVVNAVAGAGTLITFPTLLALGYPPIVANVSNTVGLIPASVTGAYGFRKHIRGFWPVVTKMAVLSAAGGIVGAALLLFLPAENFAVVVPFLLVLSAILALAQPRVARWVRRGTQGNENDVFPLAGGLAVCIFAAGIYGGYFGAAQGVILLALLGAFWSTDLNLDNGAKNVLAGTANVVSAAVFIGSGMVDWRIALIIAFGSAIGGWVGAKVGRRLPAVVLRWILVVTAAAAAVFMWSS